MTSLAAIKKQIAELEAQAAQIAKKETTAAVDKIKSLMASFGLTAEHLGLSSARGKRAVAKKSSAKSKSQPKRVGAGAAKYADPKTGKTWSGFGRVPLWIAGAKNRAAFLVNKVEAAVAAEPVKAMPAAKKVAKKAVAAVEAAAPAKKSAKPAAKPVAKKSAAPAKKRVAKAEPVAAVPAVAQDKPAAKKAAVKKPAAKAAAKPAKPAPAKAPAAAKPSKKAAAKKSVADAPAAAAPADAATPV